jgi:NAD(P)H dehydrogenase (quinone)
MKVLVMYYSRGGNTKKLAERIAAGVKSIAGMECDVKAVADITKDDFLEADGIIAGSPAYYGGMAGEMKTLFDRMVVVRSKMADKIGAAFATSGDPAGGKETTMFSIIQAMLINGMIIVGDPLDATGHYGVSCVGAPDKEIAENAAKLGKRVAELVKKLRG